VPVTRDKSTPLGQYTFYDDIEPKANIEEAEDPQEMRDGLLPREFV